MEIRFRLCFKTPLLSLDLRIIKAHFREIFWDRTSVQSFLIIGVYKWLFIINYSGSYEDPQENPTVDAWTSSAFSFSLLILVSVKCMLNAYVIEILIVRMLYMIRKLVEIRVYFISLVLFSV